VEATNSTHTKTNQSVAGTMAVSSQNLGRWHPEVCLGSRLNCQWRNVCRWNVQSSRYKKRLLGWLVTGAQLLSMATSALAILSTVNSGVREFVMLRPFCSGLSTLFHRISLCYMLHKVDWKWVVWQVRELLCPGGDSTWLPVARTLLVLPRHFHLDALQTLQYLDFYPAETSCPMSLLSWLLYICG
jgi:hypothetical protein